MARLESISRSDAGEDRGKADAGDDEGAHMPGGCGGSGVRAPAGLTRAGRPGRGSDANIDRRRGRGRALAVS